VFSDRTTARLVGALFIIASATAIVGGSLLLPVTESGYLADPAASEVGIISGALLELVLVISVVAISVLMFPILKRRNEGMALGYVGARTLEGVLLLAATVSGLLVFSLGQDHGGSTTASVQTLGDTLLTARDWTYLIGSLVAFGVSAIVLNTLLARSELVPLWLSAWGLIGGMLIAVRGIMEMYGADLTGFVQGVFAAPIGIQEMVFAVWLIVKGFGSGHHVADAGKSVERVPERV
jgi:hypothetical protein